MSDRDRIVAVLAEHLQCQGSGESVADHLADALIAAGAAFPKLPRLIDGPVIGLSAQADDAAAAPRTTGSAGD